MFKRLKDKITEEVKISPSKFSASVQQWQQMAQAVVSPTSNSVIEAPSMDSFSIDGDYDETPQNSPAHGSSRASDRNTPTKSLIGDPSTFTLVDLQESTPTPVSGHAASRRSSFASTTSDSPAILFPVLESGTANHFQSDLESCSERDESLFSSNVDNVSKEQLLSAFRKTQQRYHKYKGRYTDLVRHYRELERENTKARTVLAECQDKALRRTAELKEQCQLEQKAKAHLEEVLRSDLEEKDHLIHTLETKIQLLKSGVDPSKVSASASAQAKADATADANANATEAPSLVSSDEPKSGQPSPALTESETEMKLKEKVAKLEGVLQKCKEAIHAKQERLNQLEKEKENMSEREAELQNQLKNLQLREEETSLSVAENKLMVHQELESKEELIRQLNKQLATANSRSTDLQKEIEQLHEGFKKDLAAGKQEASRLIQAEMQQILGANKKLEELVATRDHQLSEQEASLSTANLRLHELKDEVAQLREKKQLEANSELSNLQAKVAELERTVERSDLSARLEPVLRPLLEIKYSAQQLRGELTESLKATKGYVQHSVQDIYSKSSQLLEDSKEELERLREENKDNQSKVQKLLDKIKESESYSKEKEEAVRSLESELSSERQSGSDLKKTLEELKNQMEKNEEAKRSLEQQLEKSELAVQQYKTELEQMREGLLSAESSEKKFIQELQDEIRRKEEEAAKLSEEAKTLEEQLGKEHRALEEMAAKANGLAPLELQVDSLKSDYAQLLETKDLLEASNKKCIDDLEQKNLSLSGEIDALKLEKSKLSEEIGRLEEIMVQNETIQLNEVHKSETELNEKNAENEQLKTSLTSLQASHDSFKEEYAEVSRKLEESEKKHKELKAELDAANTEITRKQEVLSGLEAQLAALSSSAAELAVLKEEKAQLSETVALLESRLQHSSEEMQNKEGLMEEKQVELGNLLNLRTQELQELREELGACKTELSNKTNLLEVKTREYESLVNQSSAYADDLSAKSNELLEKTGECEKLAAQTDSLEKSLRTEKLRLGKMTEELTALKKEDNALREENRLLSERVHAAEKAKTSLDDQLKQLSVEHSKQAQLLKVKTDECAEKEAQLDNLADEMKRVDELSQELGRISDESEANVQVLSAEASSLALKVEELTAKTQQMKEREVELVAKAQLADECQAEYMQLKEAKAELQAKLDRAEKAEHKLAQLKEAQVQLGNRLKQAEDFEKQWEHLKVLASKVPELEKRCAQLKEAQEQVTVLEEKCARLAEECAQLQSAQLKVTQLEAECQELEELRSRCAGLAQERDLLVKDNDSLSELRKECVELSTECAQLRESQSLTEDLKIRSADLEEQLKKSSGLEEELLRLREENSQLEKLRESLLGAEQESDRLKTECLNIGSLEAHCKTLTARVSELEAECERLRSANEVLKVENALEKSVAKDELDNLSADEKVEDKNSLREVELECQVLREQLKEAKTEIEDLRSDLEFVRSVPVEKQLSPAKKQTMSSFVSALEDDNSLAMPVVEEPMVAKKVKDLYKTSKDDDEDDEDESDDDEERPKEKQNWKEAYESLLLEHNSTVQSNQQIIEDLKEQLKVREEKQRRKPWERKEQDNSHFAAVESKAMTAEGNSVGGMDRLQHQIAGLQTQLKESKRLHRQEVSDLRRMLLNNSHGSSHGACTLEDATELEYLRNILFEYMMGKEPMVLARVIAAVVKFDSDQTKKILQKEEQRLTLLGHLGIS